VQVVASHDSLRRVHKRLDEYRQQVAYLVVQVLSPPASRIADERRQEVEQHLGLGSAGDARPLIQDGLRASRAELSLLNTAIKVSG
jgi:tetrahydromethanopterin S-methyltransferase subunit G